MLGRALTLVLLITAAGQPGALGQSAGAGHDKAAKAKHRPKVAGTTRQSEGDIGMLLGRFGGIPAEFQADLLLKSVESGRASLREEKILLIERAFSLARETQYRAAMRPVSGTLIDSRAGYLGYAYQEGLDALSLQSRAIRAALPVDKRLARRLISELPGDLYLQGKGCASALVYDPGEFYDTLREVLRIGFTRRERLEGEHVYLLGGFVDSPVDHAQVVPLAGILAGSTISPAELQGLVRRFGKAILQIPANDRSFAEAMLSGAPVRAFAELRDVCAIRKIPTADLVRSAREYVLKNLNATRCSDNRAAPQKAIPAFVRVANADLFRASPITADDITLGMTDGAAADVPYFESARSQQLMGLWGALKRDSRIAGAQTAEDVPSVWWGEFDRFYEQFLTYSAADEQDPRALFHQKAVLWRGMIDFLPVGIRRDGVVGDYVKHLTTTRIKREHPAEWFTHARHALELYASDGRMDERSNELLMGDEVLSLYAEARDR